MNPLSRHDHDLVGLNQDWVIAQGQRTLSSQFDKDLRQVLLAPTTHPPPHRPAVLVGHLLK